VRAVEEKIAGVELSAAEKIHLAATVRRGFDIRRMKLKKAGLSHISDTTVLRLYMRKGLRPTGKIGV